MVRKLLSNFIVLKRYGGDSYFIWRTCRHITLSMAKSTKLNFERNRKKCLLSLDFAEVSEIFAEEETIKRFSKMPP